ncbi:hypothetical protein BDN70DRAFT_871344 [Pholiota conissans]|uniref:Uncharacterized protein n=1 Tax=Pholiota conissans TaxID=109636 RepID=A0A9P6D743_9AGAR|nr:hypothetical protein BDN70DRAFT_871344 [Pholiota conissans]
MYYANKCHKKKSENQASESLLTLIQELVQETSAWDDSLFVDHKFKAMINDSKQIVTVSLPNQHQRQGKRTASYGSRLGRSCIKVLEGIPELEVEG